MDWSSAAFGAFMCLCAFVFLNDCALFAVLRRRTFLWHAVRTLLIMTMALCSAGIALPGPLAEASTRMTALMIASVLSLAALAMFVSYFLERRHVKGLIANLLVAACVSATAASFIAPFTGASLWLNSAFNSLAGISVALILASLVTAVTRGSYHARYLVAALALGFVVAGYILVYGAINDAIAPNFMLLILPAFALEFLVTVLAMAQRFVVITREKEAAHRAVRKAIKANRTDPLTGLPNRRALEKMFEGKSGPTPQGIAIVDLDRFKGINDRFGHAIGDEVLVAAGNALEQDGIFAARLGGEEFVLVLFGKDWAKQAERARRNIRMHVQRQVPSMLVPVTASAGLASFTPGDSLSEAMKRADLALYAAKQAGRDRSLALTFFEDHRPEWPSLGKRNAA